MKLDGFFEENKRIAVAFSGGVDSAYLLYAAVRAGADVKAYCVRSAFQPGFEFEDARKLAEQIGAEFEVIEVDVLSDEKVNANPADRCYYCKTRIMTAVKAAASADGYKMVCAVKGSRTPDLEQACLCVSCHTDQDGRKDNSG